MSEEKIKQPKPRLTSWLKQKFGESILEEIRTGKRTIKFNGTELNANDKSFRDKRVTGTSKVEITPEPKIIYRDTDSVIMGKEAPKTGIVPRDITQEKDPQLYVKNFLTSDQIKSVKEGKANVFIDGLVTTLDKEVEIDNDTNPTLDGKPVEIKVLPQFELG